MKTRKNNGGFSTVIIIVVICALGFVVWRLYDVYSPKTANVQDAAVTTDPNAGYVVIKEWGVRFKPVAGLDGVMYYHPSQLAGDVFTFTTEALAAQEPGCREDSGRIAIGLLSRSKEETDPSAMHVGDYYYRYVGSQAPCSSSNLERESALALKINQSLKTIEPAK